MSEGRHTDSGSGEFPESLYIGRTSDHETRGPAMRIGPRQKVETLIAVNRTCQTTGAKQRSCRLDRRAQV